MRRQQVYRGDLEHIHNMQLQYGRILTHREQLFLNRSLFRIQNYPQCFARTEQTYSETLGIFLLSEWPDKLKKRLLECVPRRACGLRRLCYYCAYVQRQQMFRKYLTQFRQGSGWYHVTLSSKERLTFDDYYAQEFDSLWDAYGYAGAKLYEGDLAEGVAQYNGIHVYSYLPDVCFTPHDHLLVISDTDPSDLRENLLGSLRAYNGEVKIPGAKVKNFQGRWGDRDNRWGILEPKDYPFTPDIDIKPIEDEVHFANVLSYFVPHDLASTYMRQWQHHNCFNDLDTATLLNDRLDELIFNWHAATVGRHLMHYMGRLHWRSADRISVDKDKRHTRQHQDLVRAILIECTEKQRLRAVLEEVPEPELAVPESAISP